MASATDCAVIPIIGARKLAQVKDNLACVDIRLEPAFLQRLDAVSRIEMGFPHDLFDKEKVRPRIWRRCGTVSTPDEIRPTTGTIPPRKQITHKKGKHHGIRNPRQYGSPVSKLCFGTMTFGDGRGLLKAIGAVGQAGADELVKASIDGGINFFDTADVYTEGESEKILGQSLKNLNIARKMS